MNTSKQNNESQNRKNQLSSLHLGLSSFRWLPVPEITHNVHKIVHARERKKFSLTGCREAINPTARSEWPKLSVTRLKKNNEIVRHAINAPPVFLPPWWCSCNNRRECDKDTTSASVLVVPSVTASRSGRNRLIAKENENDHCPSFISIYRLRLEWRLIAPLLEILQKCISRINQPKKSRS